jgi:Na+/H+ antiporter NhaD/arsenite permease-like protein
VDCEPQTARAAVAQSTAHRLALDLQMSPTPIEILASVFFGLAVLHTFAVKRFAHWAHRFPKGSIQENTLHFLAETEVVFGLWAAALFLGIAAIKGSIHDAVSYVEGLNFTEPKFVLVVMVVAASRPIVKLAEQFISLAARLIPAREGVAFYVAALTLGPLLGSLITEPAAMTLLALVLKRRYFNCGITTKLAYATLGLLFVNVSIGGTLTHFAAPPVLMVAAKWKWDTMFMLTHFGWRAVASCVVSTVLVLLFFRTELARIPVERDPGAAVPAWLTLVHVVFLCLVVAFAHHPDVFFGIFVLFLGVVTATNEYQDSLKLREGLLVGFFLAGLVTLGSLQSYWLKPLIQGLGGSALFFGATGLTAITDNAALTYLGSLVEGISDELKYALVAGAVTGGGLTVIANAPNPAGVGILCDAKVFQDEGISPLGLFLGALVPTFVGIVFFWILR